MTAFEDGWGPHPDWDVEPQRPLPQLFELLEANNPLHFRVAFGSSATQRVGCLLQSTFAAFRRRHEKAARYAHVSA
jgi:hypothetical protein